MISRVRNRVALPLLLATSAAVGCAHSAIPPAFTGSSIKPASSSLLYSVLFDFGSSAQGYNGAYPAAGLTADGKLLYGTTESGGAYGIGNSTMGGTVFVVTRSGKETVLHSFRGNPDGAVPVGGVIAVKADLFGTTGAGGLYNGGTVFEISKRGQKFKILHSFGNGADGVNPRASLAYLNGRLYGTTYLGGTSGDGTIFTVDPSNGTEQMVYSFKNSPDGAGPQSALIAVQGKLYGTTEQGGLGAGTVFSVTPAGAENVLYSFNNHPDGEYPVGGVVFLKAKLFGTTLQGGASQVGAVFSVTLSGQEQVLHSFGNGYDGSSPEAALIIYKGQLYGTTSAGGAGGWGTVFRIDADGTNETLLHSFSKSYAHDGLTPEAALTRVGKTMYGTTFEGGVEAPSCSYYDACRFGTVYQIVP